MPRYKNIESDNVNNIYEAVALAEEISLAEAQILVDEYVQGAIDSNDLLDDIQNQLDWIGDSTSGAIADIDTAIAAIPGFSIPAGLQIILVGMLENQKRILQIEKRELKAWRFMIKNAVIE